MSIIKNNTTYSKSEYRSIFDETDSTNGLKIYIKSGLKVYEVVAAGKAILQREDFCATKFTFNVVKDEVVSFNQGDAVSAKYDSETVFFGFVFRKERDSKGLISVTAYDQLRYLKNRRTYTRGSATLSEIVHSIALNNALRTGQIENTSFRLSPMAADNVSLLDVIMKAANDTYKGGGGRFAFYDDSGYLMLKSENTLATNICIDASQGQDYLYIDTIDENVYNMVEVYNDTKKLNLRTLATASNAETMKEWGTLILTKKAQNPENMAAEAKALLEEYNKINREIKIKGVAGNTKFRGGSRVYVSMVMGDLVLEGNMRIKKAVHMFENNCYTADIYLDG